MSEEESSKHSQHYWWNGERHHNKEETAVNEEASHRIPIEFFLDWFEDGNQLSLKQVHR